MATRKCYSLVLTKPVKNLISWPHFPTRKQLTTATYCSSDANTNEKSIMLQGSIKNQRLGHQVKTWADFTLTVEHTLNSDVFYLLPSHSNQQLKFMGTPFQPLGGAKCKNNANNQKNDHSFLLVFKTRLLNIINRSEVTSDFCLMHNGWQSVNHYG